MAADMPPAMDATAVFDPLGSAIPCEAGSEYVLLAVSNALYLAPDSNFDAFADILSAERPSST